METATIRELRLNFSSVRRKVENQGKVVITDNGVPSYLIQALPQQTKKRKKMPDFYARLVKQQPKMISKEVMEQLHEENRGDR